MTFPPISFEQWRAQVEKELAGAAFDKALVTQTPEGIALQPLYTSAPKLNVAGLRGTMPFAICVRVERDNVTAELAGGANALWGHEADVATAGTDELLIVDGTRPDQASDALKSRRFVLNDEPLSSRRAEHLALLGERVAAFDQKFPHGKAVMVSSLQVHRDGGDAAEELAVLLSTGVAYLEAMLGHVDANTAAKHLALQVALGRDTFTELAKLRALRLCWHKLLAASGATKAPPVLIHAVCSERTITQRDPWVNLLRVTTQVFAGALGGADLITPTEFDLGFGAPSELARRVARNTGLVLREESSLGWVSDPAAGSYFLDSLTDALAREAWKRFQQFEQDGGIAALKESGRLRERLDAAWARRSEQLARRRLAVLGVSEFANLDEKLPGEPVFMPTRRDAQAFEALRDAAAKRPREAVLVTLGTLAESRGRAGFAANFFAAGGVRTRETTTDEGAELVCLCGTDERYAAEAVARAKSLKAAGAKRIVLAGRPGALEGALKEAGVDTFIFMGCDVVATLEELLS